MLVSPHPGEVSEKLFGSVYRCDVCADVVLVLGDVVLFGVDLFVCVSGLSAGPSVRLVLSVRSFLSEFLHLRFARGGASCSIWKKKRPIRN